MPHPEVQPLPQVSENGDSVAITIAESENPHRQIRTSTKVLCDFLMRHNMSKEYFSEVMPSTLDGIIPNALFHTRMQRLNNSISKLRTTKDYGPALRSLYVIIYLIGGAVPVFISGSVGKAYALVWWTVGVGILFGAIMTTYCIQGSLEKLLLAEITTYSSEDEFLKLKWILLPRYCQYTLPRFAWRLEDLGLEVPWRIIVQKSVKEGEEDDVQFLPAYTGISVNEEEYVASIHAEDSEFIVVDGRPPSYMSTAV
ncbi:hypothetical protein BDR26DRAFT_858298 [Obelidium mucronatum]|nr:hypothetical protein BDR26DRAFT_858298 [Obelidium mucronatum]